MKILILPSWYIPEGGYFCQDQAIALKMQGIEVSVLANVELSWKKYTYRMLSLPYRPFVTEERGIFTFRHYRRRVPFCERTNIRMWSQQTLRIFDEYTERYGKPDLVHAHSAMWAGYVAYQIKQKYGIPYVVTEHRGRFSERSESVNAQIKDWYKPLLRDAFSNASMVIPVSGLLIKRITEYMEDAGPIEVVSNIVDTDFFYTKTNGPKNKVFTFFTANSFNEVKGYDILFKAFDEVCKSDREVRLVIAGGGFEGSSFGELVKDFRNTERVTFTGFLDKEEIRDHLWKADAFVLASRVESQSIAVLEALSTGLPVVCTDVVPREVIVEGVGYSVPINQPEALAKAMLKMMDERNQFDSGMIAQHAQNIASPDVVARKLITIYRQVLSAKDPVI